MIKLFEIVGFIVVLGACIFGVVAIVGGFALDIYDAIEKRRMSNDATNRKDH